MMCQSIEVSRPQITPSAADQRIDQAAFSVAERERRTSGWSYLARARLGNMSAHVATAEEKSMTKKVIEPAPAKPGRPLEKPDPGPRPLEYPKPTKTPLNEPDPGPGGEPLNG